MKNPYRQVLGYLVLIGVAVIVAALVVAFIASESYESTALDTELAARTLAWNVGSWTVFAALAWLVTGALTWREPATGKVAGSDDDDEELGLPGNRVTIVPKRLQASDES